MTTVNLGEDFDETRVFFGEADMKWPVIITGANRNKLHLSDDEGRDLMRALIKRYPIEALGAISDD